MELNVRRSGAAAAAVALTAVLLLAVVPEAQAVRYIVGSGLGGWGPNINYTIWASDKHFYSDDWLYFVYDRNQQNILEVNKTDYEACNADHPLHNWTTGAGRDVVPLNVTHKTFYFISGKGFCFSGMKLAVYVEKHPPPPTSAPSKSGSWSLLSAFTFKGQILVPALFAVAATWDAFVLNL